MDYHKNARTTVWSREQMARRVIEQGCTLAAAAAAANVSAKTASKWVRRYREQGAAGLADRTCRPHRLHRPTRPAQAELVEQLRRQRWTGLRISQQTGLSRATVSRILRRRKLNRMRDLEPRQPVERYEHERPGDLLHLDIKKLGRIVRPGHRVTGNPADRTRRVGWEYVHVAIDDHSRIAFSAIFADEKAGSTVAFLQQALDYYARFGIRFKAVLTDNGPAYRSRAFAVALPNPGPQASLHEALHATHQRQRRTIHPHRSTGMGLRAHLSEFRGKGILAHAMDPRIQLAQTTCQPQPQLTY